MYIYRGGYHIYIYIYMMYTWRCLLFTFIFCILYCIHTDLENRHFLPISPVITSLWLLTIAIGDLGRPCGGPDASLCHGTCLAWRHPPSASADCVGLIKLRESHQNDNSACLVTIYLSWLLELETRLYYLFICNCQLMIILTQYFIREQLWSWIHDSCWLCDNCSRHPCVFFH